jgi:hypothetical protein
MNVLKGLCRKRGGIGNLSTSFFDVILCLSLDTFASGERVNYLYKRASSCKNRKEHHGYKITDWSKKAWQGLSDQFSGMVELLVC